MDLTTVLKRLGLSRHADEIYRALEKRPEGMIVSHLARSVKLARQQVYRNLEELIEAGFVTSFIQGKRTLYCAQSSRRIEDAFIAGTESMRRGMRLHRERHEPETLRHLRFFKGFAGVRAVFDDVIERTAKGDTFYRYTSERDLARVNQYLSPSYRARRDRKKLERLVISNPASGRQKKSRLERFIKYIEPEEATFDQNIIQLVYADRLAFINIDTEEAFIIEDAALAAFQKVIFRQLYRKL